MNVVAKRLEALGIVLPHPPSPVANYVPAARTGSLVFISGQLPLGPDGKLANAHTGKLGAHSPVEIARQAAELAAINVLAQLQAELSSLDRVSRVVRLGGFFAVDGLFEPMAQAMNGASNLIAKAFEDRGRHARTTVGVAYLPLNAICEVEGLFAIEP
jgi:enamine deaminase RidA (YjgF/YER057c/UK114 family)